MNKITVNDTFIEILVNNLINLEYDAIVIPSNSRLLPSGNLRCEVLRKAGAHVQMECNKIINKLGVLEVGSAVMTSAGNLKSKYIIHTNAPKLGKGTESKKLSLCVWNSLAIADKAGLKSIAFDPIAMENIGFNPTICAKIMLPTIRKYVIEKNRNLKYITIVLKDLPEYLEFEKILKNLT